jgi:hypothetical protein
MKRKKLIQKIKRWRRRQRRRLRKVQRQVEAANKLPLSTLVKELKKAGVLDEPKQQEESPNPTDDRSESQPTD